MPKLSTQTLSSFQTGHLPLGLFVFEDGGIAGAYPAPAMRTAILDEAKADGFKGGPGETAVLSFSDKGGKRRCVLAGVGARKDFGAEAVRRACAALLKTANPRFEKLV